jgi:hypothetical protein
MIEGNDQSLEYVGYQVPRSELDANPNDAESKNISQGIFFFLFLVEKPPIK